jgi:hypothetical protein
VRQEPAYFAVGLATATERPESHNRQERPQRSPLLDSRSLNAGPASAVASSRFAFAECWPGPRVVRLRILVRPRNCDRRRERQYNGVMVGLRPRVAGSCALICLAIAGGASAAHGPGAAGSVPREKPYAVSKHVAPPSILRNRFPHLQPGCTARPFSDGSGTIWVQTCFIG